MRILALGFVAAWMPGIAFAGTLTVGAGQQYPGLQAAVTAAISGDTILVVPGTYTVGATINMAKSLTIRGSGGTPVFQATGTEILRITAGTTILEDIKFLPSGQRALRISGGSVTLDTIEVTRYRKLADDPADVRVSVELLDQRDDIVTRRVTCEPVIEPTDAGLGARLLLATDVDGAGLVVTDQDRRQARRTSVIGRECGGVERHALANTRGNCFAVNESCAHGPET